MSNFPAKPRKSVTQHPKTVIWRHRKENLKKCSLRGLESRPDCAFYSYPNQALPDVTDYIMLTLDAPFLSPADSEHGLLLIDGTWRYAELMTRQIPDHYRLVPRSIPAQFRTAYPRKQEDCSDPDRGLASVEALYVAYHLMGRDTSGLLDGYYWREDFLSKNTWN